MSAESASHASSSFTVCTPIEAHKQINCSNLHVFTYSPPISYSYLIELLHQVSQSVYTPIDARDKTENAASPTLPAPDETSLYTNDLSAAVTEHATAKVN